MTDWMRADFTFHDRRTTFLCSRADVNRSGFESRLLDAWRAAEGESPESLERMLREVILHFRPELAGCVIHFMRFDYSRQEWKIGVTHELLPLVPRYECTPTLPIDKNWKLVDGLWEWHKQPATLAVHYKGVVVGDARIIEQSQQAICANARIDKGAAEAAGLAMQLRNADAALLRPVENEFCKSPASTGHPDYAMPSLAAAAGIPAALLEGESNMSGSREAAREWIQRVMPQPAE